MKSLRVALAAICLASVAAVSAHAQEKEFAGVEKLMSPKAFEEAGLNKLTPDERARLNEFIQSYAATTNQEAANAAVDRAVKDNKIASMPQVIESRIVGSFSGYTGRSRFQLENGQVWAQSQQVSQRYPPVDSPPVIIVKAGWGHRMYVLGGGNVRVSRMK
jgi:hypothetical protein